MREILFRVWDKATHTMLLDGDKFWSMNLKGGIVISDTWSTKDCEIMQFTGVLDKNKKQIFEGDLVLIPTYDEIHELQNDIMVIEYKNGAPCYKNVFNNKIESIWHWIGDCDKDDEAEIIGNIYENPELL